MSEADRRRWNSRYAVVEPTVVPKAPDALFGFEGLLPAGGRALDLACGRGAVSVWLAQRGMAVEAIDVSGVALRSLAALAAGRGVSARVRTWIHDLDAGLPDALGAGFALVVCQRFRDPKLYAQLGQILSPGGLLAITVLSEVGGRPGPYRAVKGELSAAFAGLEVVASREAGGEAYLLARARA